MVGIVILNYNSWEDTISCINSIFKHETEIKYHIYLVDNASSVPIHQGVIDMLSDPRVSFIQKSSNEGYSSGNNVGIKKALQDGCNEILISNNDVVFKKDSICNLRNYLIENNSVGIVGPKIFLPDGKLQMINMVLRTGLKEKYMYLLRKTVFSHFVKKFIVKFCALDKDLNEPFDVHSVSGCCFMISRHCVKELTPFDENTFLYQEELIIGIRMEELGYRTVYLPSSEVIHAHSQSTKQIKAFSFKCLVESELYYFKKYLNIPSVYLIPLYLIRTLKYLVLSLKYKDFRRNLFKFFNGTIHAIFRHY